MFLKKKKILLHQRISLSCFFFVSAQEEEEERERDISLIEKLFRIEIRSDLQKLFREGGVELIDTFWLEMKSLKSGSGSG